jgi:hypothetical protein
MKDETQFEEPAVVGEDQLVESTEPAAEDSPQPTTIKTMILDHIQVYNDSLVGVALSNDSIAAMDRLIAKVEEL